MKVTRVLGDLGYVIEPEFQEMYEYGVKKAQDYMNDATKFIPEEVNALVSAYASGNQQSIEDTLKNQGYGVAKQLLPPSTTDNFAKCSSKVATGAKILSTVTGGMVSGGAAAAGCAAYSAIQWVSDLFGDSKTAGEKAPDIEVSSQDITTMNATLKHFLSKEMWASLDSTTKFYVKMMVVNLIGIFTGMSQHMDPLLPKSDQWYEGVNIGLRKEFKKGSAHFKDNFQPPAPGSHAKIWSEIVLNAKKDGYFKQLQDKAIASNKTYKPNTYNSTTGSWIEFTPACLEKKSLNNSATKKIMSHGCWIKQSGLNIPPEGATVFVQSRASMAQLVAKYGKMIAQVVANREAGQEQVKLRKWDSWHWTALMEFKNMAKLSIQEQSGKEVFLYKSKKPCPEEIKKVVKNGKLVSIIYTNAQCDKFTLTTNPSTGWRLTGKQGMYINNTEMLCADMQKVAGVLKIQFGPKHSSFCDPYWNPGTKSVQKKKSKKYTPKKSFFKENKKTVAIGGGVAAVGLALGGLWWYKKKK